MTPMTTEEVLSLFPEFAGTRRFTSAEYHRLIDAGILGPADHVEMLDGYIIYKADFVDLPTDTVFPEWRLLRRWSSAEYHKMIDLGVLAGDEKLELLDGYLVLKMPMSKARRGSLLRLASKLPSNLPSGWLLMTQCPISLDISDPEPDGAVIRGVISDYDARDVIAADFGIVIEVSDSTLELDRSTKARLYARADLPVYWIINVEDRQIEVYTHPDATANPPVYATRTDYKVGEEVPVVLDGQQVATFPVTDLIA